MVFRPQSPIRLSVPIVGQQDAGECLAACVAMVYAYFNIQASYAQLLKALKIEKGLGAPFYQIRSLEDTGISVTYQDDGTLEELYELLAAGWPVIVSVDTRELPYWQNVSTRHVIVVVGMDRNNIYVNDPEFPETPIKTSIGDFDLAWLAQGEQYAVLAPS